MDRKKYLVTGGAGFIGSNLAKALEQQGHEVTVLDDFAHHGHFENLTGFGGDVITLDLSTQMPENDYYDGIFHEAALTDTTVTDQPEMMKHNVEGFRHILDYAAENEIRKVVYASSISVYGNGPVPMRENQPARPANIYGFSKLTDENLARKFAQDNQDIKIIGLRYGKVFGPGECFKGNMASIVYQLYCQMKQGARPRLFKNGEQQQDFVYVKDIVKANLCAMKNGKETAVCNIGSAQAHSYNEVAACLNRVLNTQLEPEYIDNPHAGWQAGSLADIHLAKEKIGYEPDYPLEKAIADYVEILEEKSK